MTIVVSAEQLSDNDEMAEILFGSTPVNPARIEHHAAVTEQQKPRVIHEDMLVIGAFGPKEITEL